MFDRLTCGLGSMAAGRDANDHDRRASSIRGLQGGPILENDAFVTSDTFDDYNG